MRGALRGHLLETRDNGFMPEGAAAEGWAASRDGAAYPLERVLDLADLAVGRDVANLPKFVAAMGDSNESIRYWGALGCLMANDKADREHLALAKLLDDPSPHVRVVAAEALCRAGRAERGLAVLQELLLKGKESSVRLQAANALDHLGPIARPAWAQIKTATKDADDYVKRATRYTAAVLAGETPPGEGE
jgi:hypothetical protein